MSDMPGTHGGHSDDNQYPPGQPHAHDAEAREIGRQNRAGYTSVQAMPIDLDWLVDTLFDLVRIPSPSGRTDAVIQYIGDIVNGLGLEHTLTRQGALLIDLPGRNERIDRGVVVHADTLGCMVAELKDNGRLRVVPVGTYSARFAEGARVQIITEAQDVIYTGTILPLKTSGHAFDDAVDTQGVGWDHVEVRVDERVDSKEGLQELGIEVGNTVALFTYPIRSRSGYINSRHLDGKAGVAIALSVAKAVADGAIVLPHRTCIMVTIFEEVGHGASAGLPVDIAELVSIDNAVCAPGQASIEDGVTIPLLDMHGPFDYHLTRKLIHLATGHGLPVARDVFKYYRSDVAAALSAGAGARSALMAFGLDASHGWERTHVDALEACAKLLSLWLQTPLTLGGWDREKTGPLRNFPSQRQPTVSENRASMPTEGAIENVPRYSGKSGTASQVDGEPDAGLVFAVACGQGPR